MKTLNLGEATLRDQFRQKLVDSSRNAIPALSGLKVLGAWSLNRKNDLSSITTERAKKVVDLKAGLSLACQEGRNFRRFLAHAATYIRIPIVPIEAWI